MLLDLKIHQYSMLCFYIGSVEEEPEFV